MTDTPATHPGWGGTLCNQCNKRHVTRLDANACLGHAKHDRSKPCTNPPRTDQRVCRMHGGSSPQAKRKAVERGIIAGARKRLNIPEHVDPKAALAAELGRTQAWVEWLESQVDTVTDESLIWGRTRTVDKEGGEETTTEAKPSIWYQMAKDERKHLLLVAREAHAAGVEDRRVQLEERQARQSLELLRGALEALGHDMESPKVRQLVAATWRKIEAASGVVEASAVEVGK